MQQRGRHLIGADRRLATGGGLLARLFSGGFKKVLDRIDAGLAVGEIDALLPDGTRRLLGGRAPGPRVEVRLHNWRPLVRLVTSGSVGWYKSWEAGEWTSPDPVPLFDLFVRNADYLGNVARAKSGWRLINRGVHLLRRNSRTRSRRNIEFHYDLGNDFYAAWLDRSMTYSSAVFADPINDREPLEDAQARKIRLLLDRLELRPGQRLLEIGCGWGSLAEVAARDYGVEVVALTLSSEQKAYAGRRMAAAGLADRVSVERLDYRDVTGTFDAVASVEMVEAVGQEYWPAYLDAISRALKPGGRAALQLISMKKSLFAHYATNTDFIQAYIFPGGMLVNETEFAALASRSGLSWEDRRAYGLHYAETLKRWRRHFDRAIAEERLPKGFDERFHRLWRYYLMYCEGGFRGGGIDVAQVTLLKR